MPLDKDHLIALRRARHWTQEDLAAASGLSARTVQRLEMSGRCSLETKRAIAAAFDLRIDDLYQGVNDVGGREIKIESPLEGQSRERSKLYWIIVGIMFLTGVWGTVFLFSVLMRIPPFQDLFPLSFWAFMIVKGAFVIGALLLTPIWLLAASVYLARGKFLQAKRFVVLSFLSFMTFWLGSHLYLEHDISDVFHKRSLFYILFYMSCLGAIRFFERKKTPIQAV